MPLERTGSIRRRSSVGSCGLPESTGLISDYFIRFVDRELPDEVRSSLIALQVYEHLQLELQRVITFQYKKADEHPGWTRQTPASLMGIFRGHAADIIEYTRDVRNTKRLMARRLSHRSRPDSEKRSAESKSDRKERLAEFWTTFHDRFWDEAPPTLAQIPQCRRHMVPASPTALPLLCARSPTASRKGGLLRSPQHGMQRPSSQGSLRRKVEPVQERQCGGLVRHGSEPVNLWPPTNPPVGTLAANMAFCKTGRGTRTGAPKRSPGHIVHNFFDEDDDGSYISRRRQYIRDCSNGGVVPTTLTYMTGHSNQLSAAGRDLTDPELLAIVATLRERGGLEDVDLSENSHLTDVSMVPFLDVLDEFISADLRSLSLRQCSQVGLGAINSTLRLIKDATSLQRLDLSKVPVGFAMQLPLCDAIGRHCVLENVNLSAVGLGTSMAAACVAALLGSFKITCLDLSWNCFSADVFTCVGDCLKLNTVLKDLRFSNCSCITPRGDASCTYLFEQLGQNKSLTSMDISMNRVDFNAALVLEDSLEHHRLEQFDVSYNPLGVLGMRSLLRLLVHDTSGLTSFRSYQSSGYGGGTEISLVHEEEPVLSLSLPGRRYCLDLARPPHRSILRMLYKVVAQCGVKNEDVFLNLAFRDPEGGIFKHGTRDSQGVWQVVSRGVLSVTFDLAKVLESAAAVGIEDYNLFLFQEMRRRRVVITEPKIIPLLVQWRELTGQTMQQEMFVKALARDFNWPFALMSTFVRHTESAFAAEALTALLPACERTPLAMYWGNMLFPKASFLIDARRSMNSLLLFNASNPTGRYELDLACVADNAIAERLLTLDRWESVLDRKRGLYDTSPFSNGAHTRNETHNSKPLMSQLNSLTEWSPPDSAILALDYIGSARPGPDATVVQDAYFARLLLQLYKSICRPHEKVGALRFISPHIYITSMQLRMLTLQFAMKDALEIYVMFFTRITDWWNEKLIRDRFHEELPAIRERLGFCSVFPFVQPENTRFEFNLALNDQRICASFVVYLANRETLKKSCIDQPVLERADGSFEPFSAGVPRSWEDPARLPTSGIFRGYYICSPDARQYLERKKLAKLYSKFDISAEESSVLWWTGRSDVTIDVMKLVLFFRSIFPTSEKAFNLINGPGGNDLITVAAFKDALVSLGFQGCAGPDEKERFDKIFRFVDAGGDGAMSRKEWGQITQLWKECDLCMYELTQFLAQHFKDSFEDAWDMMDEDGSGTIELDEWQNALARMGYHGLSEAIFYTLCSRDEVITRDNFLEFRKYMSESSKKVQRPKAKPSRNPEGSAKRSTGSPARSIESPSKRSTTE